MRQAPEGISQQSRRELPIVLRRGQCLSQRAHRAGKLVKLTLWTKTDDGKDPPRDLAAADCDHQAYLCGDLPQQPNPDPRILPIRRPIDCVHRSDFLTGNAHSHRPYSGVRNDGTLMLGGETARTLPVRAGGPVLPSHVLLVQERCPRARLEHPAQEVRKRRSVTLGGLPEVDVHASQPGGKALARWAISGWASRASRGALRASCGA